MQKSINLEGKMGNRKGETTSMIKWAWPVWDAQRAPNHISKMVLSTVQSGPHR